MIYKGVNAMTFLRSIDWPLVGFISASTILDYYVNKHLAWRIAVCLPEKKDK